MTPFFLKKKMTRKLLCLLFKIYVKEDLLVKGSHCKSHSILEGPRLQGDDLNQTEI